MRSPYLSPRRKKDREDREDDDAERPEVGLQNEEDDGACEDEQQSPKPETQVADLRADRGEICGGYHDGSELKDFRRLEGEACDIEPSPAAAVFDTEARNEDCCGRQKREDEDVRREAPPQRIVEVASDDKREEPQSDTERQMIERDRRDIHAPARKQAERGRGEDHAAREDEYRDEKRKRPVYVHRFCGAPHSESRPPQAR